MYKGAVDRSLEVRACNWPMMSTESDSNAAANDSVTVSDSAPTSTHEPSQSATAETIQNDPNLSQDIEPEVEDGSETAIEEHQITEQRHQITQEATTKLHSALQRIKDVTKSMLSEMNIYLESAEGVEVDYVRCQRSQKNEGKRLMEVEPEISGTTGSLGKFQMNWQQS